MELVCFQCAVQFSAIDSEPVLVAIKCEFAAIGHFVGLGICSDCLILGWLFVSVKKIAANGKNLHWRLLNAYLDK